LFPPSALFLFKKKKRPKRKLSLDYIYDSIWREAIYDGLIKLITFVPENTINLLIFSHT
jgi:hypothetical protein